MKETKKIKINFANWFKLILTILVIIIAGILGWATVEFSGFIEFQNLLNNYDDLCINGIYCDFCSTKCICNYGFKGSTCNELNYTGTYYPKYWWDHSSMESEYKGIKSNETCRETCTNDTNCNGYYWDYCEPPYKETICVIRRSNYDNYDNDVNKKKRRGKGCGDSKDGCGGDDDNKRRKIETSGETWCCPGPPNEECCYPRCHHVKDSGDLDKSIYIVTYERNSSFEISLPTRRTVEYAIISQPVLYLKNGFQCFGYICTYNDEYGLVHVDDHIFQDTKGIVNDLFSQVSGWSVFEAWPLTIPNTMNNYSSISTRFLKDVVEITELPHLQMKHLLTKLDPIIYSITVFSSRGFLFKSVPTSDYYDYEFKGHKLNIEDDDLSKHYIKPKLIPKLYDFVILTIPSYGRKNVVTLLTNAYNMLKNNGFLVIRGQYWDYINSTVITNWCMGAGMIKKKLLTEFLLKFTQLHYEESEPMIEPYDGEEERIGPMPYKDSGCWYWSNEYVFYNETLEWTSEYIHPNHTTRWFSFIGKKK